MKHAALAFAIMALGALPAVAEEGSQVYKFSKTRVIFYCDTYQPLTDIMAEDNAGNVEFLVGLLKTDQNPDAPCNFVTDASGQDFLYFTEVTFDPEVQHNIAAVDGVGSLVQYGKLVVPASETTRYVVMMQYFKADSAGVYQPQGWFEPIGNNFLNALLEMTGITP